ncbi:MAG: DUF4157 domain-containing protein [Chloroflexi bacterium]|nr:DUF4157 domain-containing protein [Chloroflexota bacterium]
MKFSHDLDAKSPLRGSGNDGKHERTKGSPRSYLTALQRLIGNRAVQRLVAQLRGEGESFELDDETAQRIERERSGGGRLPTDLQQRAGAALGYDLADVRVHTSVEADALARELGARAFTTGRDIFFRQGAYDPHSSAGKELLTHELTHVAQQASGAVNHPSGRMMVNPPDDAFERQADAASRQVSVNAQTDLQRQPLEEEEEEELLQTQEEEEKEEEILA